MSETHKTHLVWKALDAFHMEVPAWGFANTTTHFGKYVHPAAATNLEEKLSDAAQVHRFTRCCPTVSLHAVWDFASDQLDEAPIREMTRKEGISIGTIHPNLFQDQVFLHGSLGNPNARVRQAALEHIQECIQLAKQLECHQLSLWFADGSNYPGTAHIRQRREWFKEGLHRIHELLGTNQKMLIEYKPYEPWFYHSDIADWGMALLLARAAGSRTKVLMDLGHHYQYQNVEQIVAWLLAEDMLGGFHFNDRPYADHDLTLGSIDPYQVFRIFHEIIYFEWENERRINISYALDQSHNLKGKIEAMIQTVISAQELYAKASLVDHLALAQLQAQSQVIEAEECLKEAFYTDVRPILQEWRQAKGLTSDPLLAFRESGYLARITQERQGKNRQPMSPQ